MNKKNNTRAALPLSDRMIIKAASRLNPAMDCRFILDWMRQAAQTEEARQAVTDAALRLNIDRLTA